MMNSLEPSRIVRLVKSEDLNHHRTLFAGRGAEWLVEACFVAAARFIGNPADVVCVQIHGLHFRRPVRLGDILEIRSRVAHAGSKSVTVLAECFRDSDGSDIVECFATFVTVDQDGRSYAHGKVLPPEYVAANQAIHEKAQKLRPTRT